MKQLKHEAVDMDKYRNQWIAFVRGKIVASGGTMQEVEKKARRFSKRPEYFKVPSDPLMIL